MNKPMTREEIDFLKWAAQSGADGNTAEDLIIMGWAWEAAAEKYQQKPNTGCSNCVKIFNGSKKIITDMGEVVQELNAKIKYLTPKYKTCPVCNDNLYDPKEDFEIGCGDSVMPCCVDCFIESAIREKDAKIKELEKEVESLKPKFSDKRVAYCEKCHKFLSEDLIDEKTGCCEGGCK